ncbi:phage protein [Pseudomonas phage PA01]|uniref:Phage protein n=1 Tax=Pseudomonas phage PA01 TaxID=2498591 RepID=A0A455VYD8_9CAUD|nr:phage protein [Pseudomonas phage PA01]BBI98283.1 phage protein [Pseudomonas phage PA01]
MAIELVYRTSDGAVFSSVHEAEEYEARLEACELLKEEIEQYGLNREQAQGLALALTEKFRFTPIPEDF